MKMDYPDIEMREAEQVLKNIIDSIQDAISVVDENGMGLIFNKAYYRLTGLQEKDVLHKPAAVDIAEGDSIHMKVLAQAKPIRGVPMKVGPYRRDVLVSCAPLIINGLLKGSVGIIHDITEIRSLIEELKITRQKVRQLESKYTFEDIIGESAKIKETISTAEVAATTPANVMLRGDCGTGKELFAHAIHDASHRRQKKFLRVNCSALHENLLESELFGYTEGSFTGALKKGRRGLFEEADGGTLFLDEIGSMSLNLQVKLLRVLQEGEISKVGNAQAAPVDVRVITATNADLEELIRRGSFRQDLYYRLNVFPIYIPPLRERVQDIPLIARHFLNHISQDYNRTGAVLSEEAMEKLLRYSWPGNVRELKNVIARALINLKRDELVVQPKHLMLPGDFRKKTAEKGFDAAEAEEAFSGGGTLAEIKDRCEEKALREALKTCQSNKTEAAKILGISIRSLYNKLKRYGLED
jgi:PAS domain S-box-containing protein